MDRRAALTQLIKNHLREFNERISVYRKDHSLSMARTLARKYIVRTYDLEYQRLCKAPQQE